jgi:flagellar basal-body rod protein FlgF
MADYAELTLARGLAFLAEQQATITHNLANADSAGFKRRVAYAEPAPKRFAEMLGRELESVRFDETIDWSAGNPQPTGSPWNVTAGEGAFFRVRAADGRAFYTRGGDLVTDAAGRLVTKNGYAFLDPGGNEIYLRQVDGKPVTSFSVFSNGEIVTETREGPFRIGALGLFTVADRDALEPAGNGCYQDLRRQPVTSISVDSVRQGFLERSNVDAIEELVDMIVVQRAFTASQRAMTTLHRIKTTYLNTFDR